MAGLTYPTHPATGQEAGMEFPPWSTKDGHPCSLPRVPGLLRGAALSGRGAVVNLIGERPIFT